MLKDTLFAFSIPLGIKGICYLAENLLPSLFPRDEDPISWIEKLNHLISACFTNPFSFILMMVIFNLFVESIKAAYHDLISPTQTKCFSNQYPAYSNPFNNEEGLPWKMKGVTVRLCKLMMCYTILFGIWQLTSMMRNLIFDDEFFYRNDPVLFNSDNLDFSKLPQTQAQRNLDQSSISESFEERITSPNLNPGEILGSFSYKYESSRPFDPTGAVLSKDGRILFAAIQKNLYILNISNPQKEQRIGEIYLHSDIYHLIMLLSQDETVLFVRSRRSYMIIDISNLSAPVMNFRRIEPKGSLVAMAMSSDGNTLYSSSNETFTIYNISQPTSPVLLYQKTVDKQTSMALSNDNSKIIISRSQNFEILNVTDPSNPVSIWTGKNPWKSPEEIAFSNDGKRIFAAGKNQGSGQISLQTFDIQNLASPLLISSADLGPFIQTVGDISLWFDQNKRFAFYFTKNEFKMIELANLNQVVLFPFKEGAHSGSNRAFVVSHDYQRGIVFLEDEAVIVRFNIGLDVSFQSFFHFKPNALKVIDGIDYHRMPAIALSRDEKTLFLTRVLENNRQLLSFRRASNTLFQKSNSVKLQSGTEDFSGSDVQWSLVAGTQSVGVVGKGDWTSGVFDFVSILNTSSVLTQRLGPIEKVRLRSVAITEDEKTIVFIKCYVETPYYLTLNIITFQNGKANYFLDFVMPPPPTQHVQFQTSSIKISRNGNIAFCADYDLHVYNITKPASPLLKSSIRLGITRTLELTLSKDERMLYHIGYNKSKTSKTASKKLQILDISNIETHKLVGSIWFDITSERIDSLELSHDEKILFIGFPGRMMMIDVRIPSQPAIFGSHYLMSEISGFQFANNKSIFYTASSSGVSVFDLTAQYFLRFKTSDFKIGGSYPINLNVLKLNSNRKLDFINKHKFLKASIFDCASSSSTILPLWITLDKERGLLVVEPKAASNVGNYKILVTLSTQTQASTFVGLESISTEPEAKKLMSNLLQYGYLDTEGYISENFDPSRELWLDPKYQSIENDIRALLSQNYIQAIGEFSVAPSLDILETNPLTISALNKDHISVTIQLDRNETAARNAYFLTKTYPNLKSTIMNERSLLLLEGSLDNVNEGLKQIFIDLNELPSPRQGNITITDGINLPVSRSFSNISKYFNESFDPISLSQGRLIISGQPNTANIIVSIHLVTQSTITNAKQPYFVSKTYAFLRWSLTDNQKLLFLEGSPADINQALQEIIIDLNGFSFCQGVVNFTDGVNPLKSKSFPKISTYFNQSKEAIDISQDNKLIISSLALNGIASVQLFSINTTQRPYFISKSYPYLRSSLTDQQTLLFLEGPLTDINSAFGEIVIDLNGFSSCNGIVNFTDGVNPPKSRFFSDISIYLNRSKETISISQENKLVISSLATNAIVSIQLLSASSTERPYFLSKSYPYLRSSLTDQQTLLFLEGPLSDINSALQKVIIDLNTLSSCDGIVNITDGLNLPKSRFFSGISNYLNVSKETISTSQDRKLVISSLATNVIASIQLLAPPITERPYFISKSYPYLRSSLTDRQTLLFLEGPLADVNSALREVMIDLNTLSSCSGIVNLTDGINLPKSRFFSDISTYLNVSKNAISISQDNKLFISSFATNIIVNIQLLTPTSIEKPYFISKSYPYLRSSLTDQQTLLFLEGSLTDVNSALREVVIDLNGFSSCNGIVNFTDGVNPPKSTFFSNISTYLNISKDAISISQENKFVLSSLFPSHLTITIQLDLNQSAEYQAHFINKPYSFVRFTIANNKTMIHLEGSMIDLNEVLKVIEVDHGKLEFFSGGNIIIKDGINPPITKYFEDLTKHFSNHTAPDYNKNLSIQDQIDKRPFYTGLYQMVELHPATFTDKNGLPLEYSLEMEGSPLGLPPSWISFKALNLMGTPPEKLSPLSYNFVLKVKNEFRTTETKFTLNVHISFVYAAKLTMTYVGYIISFIGLTYSINKVYNLLAMKYYRYPRSFKLRVGEKITDNEIFPLSFVKAERTKSKEIFKALQKHVTQNYQSSLLEYFIVPESKILDREKITSTLDELDHKYSSAFSKGIIKQLIINMIVMTQIAQKQEAETKKIFVKIKDKWMDLVFPAALPSQFILSQEKLQQELAKISPEFAQEKDLNESTLSTELLSLSLNEKINMDLLCNAILAHAFDRQNLNTTSVLTDVISYKKLKGNSLWHKLKKLLLKDLKPFVVLNKREIGYGIEYNIDDETLFFSGQLTHDLQDNIIVIHIKNNRGRILRELWLTGEDKDVKRFSIMDQIPEPL